jgi:predicted RNA-binding protein with PUA-like domain
VGLASVVGVAQPDDTQFDSKSEFFDPKATRDKPRWFCPDIGFVKKFPTMVSLESLRQNKALEGLLLLQKGSRLSVIPVSERHFRLIVEMGRV